MIEIIDFLFEPISYYIEVSNEREMLKTTFIVMSITFSLMLAIAAERGAYVVSLPIYIMLSLIPFFYPIPPSLSGVKIFTFAMFVTFPVFFIVLHLPIGESPS